MKGRAHGPAPFFLSVNRYADVMLAHRRLTAAFLCVCTIGAFTVIPSTVSAAADAGSPLQPNWIILDATVTVIGVPGKSWTQPSILVNRDQMLALYLG